jgi:hypothetical protein
VNIPSVHLSLVDLSLNSKVSQAFKGNGIPLTVLIDAQGKIVYDEWGGND